MSVYNTCLHVKAKHNCNNLALVNLLHSSHHYGLKSKVRSRQTGLGTGSWLCENAYSNTDIWRILSQGITVPKSRFMQGFLFFLILEVWKLNDKRNWKLGWWYLPGCGYCIYQCHMTTRASGNMEWFKFINVEVTRCFRKLELVLTLVNKKKLSCNGKDPQLKWAHNILFEVMI